MPPTERSRTRFCSAYVDNDLALVLTDYVPYTYRDLADNISHVVVQGDSLTTLAYKYYGELDGAALLWWVIADFQVDGVIYDPTVALTPGSTLVIPSARVVLEEIFNERRRKDFQA